MRDWNLGPGDPLQLTIAADARLTTTDYLNDHIWELDLSGGDPAALALRTTYGLRARLMRLFPRFTENGKTINDPAAFVGPPRVRRFYPNFLTVTFSPLAGLEVSADYWVADSHVVAGRLTLTNRSVTPRPLRLEWVAQLSPLEGRGMAPEQKQSAVVLQGQVENLFPVLFLTGGPQAGPGPYSSLALLLDFPPGGTRQVTWVLAALDDPQASFDLARRTAARSFEAEKTRIALLNTSEGVDIFTGDPDWDAAFAFSQKAAYGLFHSPTEHLPHPSFVFSRQPDQGFSRLGNGSDYSFFWSGQSPFETYYLASLLPCHSELMRGVLKNFLAVQDSHDGSIDNKPGLAGQRARFLAAPYLASLAWRLSCRGRDREFISAVYPALAKFFWSWFSPTRDHDRNGLPEWQHQLQTGFEDNPLFEGWHAWAQGIDITTVQSPALAAALYREAQSLMRMAELLGRTSDTITLKAQAALLRKGVQACWDADAALYRYTDRDTHLSPAGKVLSERQAAPVIELQKDFKHPVRLVIRIFGQGETLKRPRVTITGELDEKPQFEVLDTRDFAFSSSGAVATTEKVYTSLGKFEFEGLSRRDRVSIQTADLTIADHTLLLPLWAGIPDEHEAHALVFRTLLSAEHFDHPYGIPALPRLFLREADPVSLGVHLPWNQLIAEGLLQYGYRREAARLTAHLMAAVIQNLKRSHAFYRTYHAESGAGQGERNALHGLAPIGLFLRVLGVEILSPQQVLLRGENPFPWTVTVKYRGLTVTRQMTQTEIIFPNGQPVVLNDPTNALVTGG
ncbi:MAG: hypothetical protein N2117_08670 [Anaerolineales bacterium]|nr:hypothetical protein [Anaerolineales bacterium]MCX7755306.1 hypothetical protein [Anaerolineales bacterium]MDW8278448.1 hypothetical protein [Anaerolineales bacterium]